MTALTEAARELHEIAEDADNRLSVMLPDELTRAASALLAASYATTCVLAERCAGNVEQVQRLIAEALKTPVRALRHQSAVANQCLNAGATVSPELIAAHVALTLRHIEAIGAEVERRRCRSSLN